MSIKCILIEQVKSSQNIYLDHIEIISPPTKTSYLSGETFNTSGLVIRGYYASSGVVVAEAIIEGGYMVSPTTLIDGITTVTISFSD